MNWTPEAEAALAKVPPFVRVMARNERIPPDGLASSWASAIAGEHEGRRQRAIYVHVPFCWGHCLFCGFYQNACQPERMRRYVDTLLLEIVQTASAPFARRAPRGVDLMRKHHQRRLSITHWAQSTRERSLYNALSRGRSECLPFGAGGGWLAHRMFFLETNLEEYATRVAAGQKSISMGFEGTERDLHYRDIAYQIELGYCDLSFLAGRYHTELMAGIGPVLEQWEKVGLVQLKGNFLHLTRAGEFWAANLAQVIIDALQLCQKTTK